MLQQKHGTGRARSALSRWLYRCAEAWLVARQRASAEAAAREHLALIAKDATAFLARTDDREAKGGDITLPDGSTVPRLPGFVRWMWDGEFCGQIGFRWQPGTEALPPHCLGHMGYAVVAWKRGRGYATRALALMLAEARKEGLAYVELTTDPDNLALRRR